MESKQTVSGYDLKREQQRVKLSLQKSMQKLVDKIGIVAASAIVGALAEHTSAVSFKDPKGICKLYNLPIEEVFMFNPGVYFDHIDEFEFDVVLEGQYRPAHFPNAPEFDNYSSPEFESYARSKSGIHWHAHGCNQNGVYLDKKVEFEGWENLVIHVTDN